MAESEDMVELEATVRVDLRIALAGLRKRIEEDVEMLQELQRQKELNLKCLEEIKLKEAYMEEFFKNASKLIKKSEVFWEDLCANVDSIFMEYPETDSEEEDPSKLTEVIEIPDEDNGADIMSFDSADTWNKLAKDQSLLHEAFLELRKSAQDVQKNYMDTMNKILASGALAEYEESLKEVMELTTIMLESLNLVIDNRLEMLEDVRRWKLLYNASKENEVGKRDPKSHERKKK